MMKLGLEELLSQLGNPGRYQIFIFILLCMNYFPVLYNHVVMAFLGARPKHQCHSRTHLASSSVNYVSDFNDVLTLYGDNTSQVGQFESCSAIYADLGGKNGSIVCPESDDSFMVYLKSADESSIVTEWDLVCDQKYLSGVATTIYFCGVMVGGLVFGHLADKFGRKPVMLTCLFMPVVIGVATAFANSYMMFVVLRFFQGIFIQKYLSGVATTVYFCGVMVGGLVFGHLADKFGRKPVMLTCLFMPVVIGVATAFVNSYMMFVVLRFFQGIFIQGLQISTYTLAMELFLPQYRSYAGTLLECCWGLGVITIPGLAYLMPNWRHLTLIISLPSLLTIFFICVIPESLRWMIMNGKMDQSEALMAKMAAWNKVTMPQQAWEKVKQQQGLDDQDQHRLYSFLDLLRTPKLRVRSLVLFYIWFATSIGYYGLTWLMTGLPGNKYLNFFIGGMVEMVAYTLVIYVTKRFGRKRPLLIYFMLASVFMLGGGAVLMARINMVYLSSGLAIAGKFAMGGIFSVIFLYSSELYPTVIRNIGMGGCAFWTRFGGVLAPQLILLGQYTNKGTPLILFGIVCLVGGFLTLLLPETLGRKLPDTIEDAENFSFNGDSQEEVNREGRDGEEMKSLRGNDENC